MSPRIPPAETAVATVAALVAGALSIYATSGQGPGVSPDSVAYLSVASNLVEGHGAVAYTGRPAPEFPPLYPLALAGLSWVSGADVLTAARALNALALAGIVLAGWLLLQWHVRWPALRLLGVAGLAGAPPLVAVAGWAWSEPLFIALSLGAIASLEPALGASRTSRWVVGAGLLAALCVATRYIGISLAIAGVGAVLAGGRKRWRSRARDAALLAAVLALGTGVVVARNLSAGSSALGTREPADVSPAEAAVLAALVVLFGGALALARAWREAATAGARPLTPLVVFVPAYALVLGAASAATPLDPIDARLLSPLVVPGMVIVLSLADRAGRPAIAARLSPRRTMVLSLVAVLTGASLAGGIGRARHMRAEGGQYDRRSWQASPLAARLKAEPTTGAIYSDAPDAVWATTGLPARCLPPQLHAACTGLPSASSELGSLQAGDQALLAWFAVAGAPRPPVERLRRVVGVREIAAPGSGALYRLTPRE